MAGRFGVAVVILAVGGLLLGVAAQHPTNHCAGPLPVGTDLSSRLASGQRNLVRPGTVCVCVRVCVCVCVCVCSPLVTA
jgi:hypothetical protein